MRRFNFAINVGKNLRIFEIEPRNVLILDKHIFLVINQKSKNLFLVFRQKSRNLSYHLAKDLFRAKGKKILFNFLSKELLFWRLI